MDRNPDRGHDDPEYDAWVRERKSARQQMSRLSPRETEVANLVSHGLYNKNIAAELAVSSKTVEKHRSNAKKKAWRRNDGRTHSNRSTRQPQHR